MNDEQRRSTFGNALLVLASVLLTLLALELGMWAFEDRLDIRHYTNNIDLLHSAYPSQYDPLLGWIPRPHTSGRENVWHTTVTIGEDGIRFNGTHTGRRIADRPLVLAVGDSYVFGDEVSDRNTFPSVLEAYLGSRVLNAGVFGYGLDQTFLRAEQLAAKYHPDILVVSLIPDDILRTEMSVRMGVAKPYFLPDERTNTVPLHNVPVPRPADPSRRIRAFLSHSHLASFIAMRLFPEYWMTGTFVGATIVHRYGMGVAYYIVTALDRLAASGAMRVILLEQYDGFLNNGEVSTARALGSFIREQRLGHLEYLDLYPVLAELKQKRPDEYAALYFERGNGHMTPVGNRLIARQLYRQIRSTH